MTKDEALDLALEIMHNQGDVGVDEWRAAEAAIKQARSAPVQPSIKQGWDVDTLLNKPAAQRTWIGLKDEQINLFINGRGDEDDDDYVEPTGDGFGITDADLVKLVRRAEAKLKEENGM